MRILYWLAGVAVIIAAEAWAINTWIDRAEQRYWETR